MPVELFDPKDKGPIKLYAGDPRVIRFRLKNMNRTTSTFTAQIRKRPRDTSVLRSFAVSVAMDGADSLITASLAGDTAPGAANGQTRLSSRSAYFDLQEWQPGGAAGDTIAFAEIEVVEDVTR